MDLIIQNAFSLSNQKCVIQPNLIYLHHNYYSQELHYYSFAVNPNLGGRGEANLPTLPPAGFLLVTHKR